MNIEEYPHLTFDVLIEHKKTFDKARYKGMSKKARRKLKRFEKEQEKISSFLKPPYKFDFTREI